MNRFFNFIAAGIALMGILNVPAQAEGLPLIVSATVDYSHQTLTISGKNFGKAPIVTLDSSTFPTQSSAAGEVVASFPAGKAPSTFVPGTYFLTLVFKNQLPAIFAVDIGANGAQGPAGPAGTPGTSGPQGPAGIPGPAGPGVDPALLQQIAILQAQLDALRQAVAVSGAGSNVQITAGAGLQVLAGGSKTETIGANSQETVGASRAVDIGAGDTVNVALDQNVTVGGNQSTNVTGTQSVSIGADQNTLVDGNLVAAAGKSLQFQGPHGAVIALHPDGSVTITTVNGPLTLTSGGDLILKATGNIHLLGSQILNN